MTLYYLYRICEDRDHYEYTRDCLEYGLFEDEGDALAEAARQNKPAILDWEKDLLREQNRISDAQRAWDVLSKAGIAKGSRPGLHSSFTTHIETGPFRVASMATIPKLTPFPCQEPSQ